MSFGQIILIISCALANLLYLYIGISTSLVQERRTRSVLTVVLTVCGLLVMVMDVDFWIFMSKNGRSGVLLNSAAILINVIIIFLMIFNIIRLYRFNKS